MILDMHLRHFDLLNDIIKVEHSGIEADNEKLLRYRDHKYLLVVQLELVLYFVY